MISCTIAVQQIDGGGGSLSLAASIRAINCDITLVGIIALRVLALLLRTPKVTLKTRLSTYGKYHVTRNNRAKTRISMNPDRGIVRTYKRSDGISTKSTYLNYFLQYCATVSVSEFYLVSVSEFYLV